VIQMLSRYRKSTATVAGQAFAMRIAFEKRAG
jgi:hypothetical protein